MDPLDVAVPVRPGEHACCRFADAHDRERLAIAFLRSGLRRGHKVVYLCDPEDPDVFVERLAAIDEVVEPALARGQLAIRSGSETYFAGGAFDADRMLELAREERDRAFAEGYTGLSYTGDMSWVDNDPPGHDQIHDYERRIADEMDNGTFIFLCQYDHRPAAGRLAGVHDVDASPELACIGRDGVLAAAHVGPERTLRLAGELDFACATTLAEVLDAHFHGTLRLDLADLSYVDVAGMRALRGRKGQPLTIAGASEAVRRLLALLAWDTDPGIELLETA
jgi:ABC-type transporter Mla MlaB component